MGRPRVLDDVKKREVCALLTAGMSLTKAADYVGCDRKTILRERRTDPEFEQRVRRARLAHDLTPREAMRRFASTHWRAAAWLLEREERHAERRRAKRESFTRADLEGLAESVKELVGDAITYPVDAVCMPNRIDDLFRRARPGAKRPPEPRSLNPTTAELAEFFRRHPAAAAPTHRQPSPPPPPWRSEAPAAARELRRPGEAKPGTAEGK